MHPYRTALHNELHARPSLYFNEPAHVFHIALLDQGGVSAAVIAALTQDAAAAEVIRGWLGIEVQPLTPELAESFGMDGRPGIVVAGIYREGPAQKAGLQPGDLILSIDGEPAGDGRRSMNQVARAKPGEKIRIDILRNGKPLQLSAEIGVRPPVNGS